MITNYHQHFMRTGDVLPNPAEAAASRAKAAYTMLKSEGTPQVNDTISLSAEAMAKQAEINNQSKEVPKIDWETRTYKGKAIPDSWHKEPTPEMLSGEQPFSVAGNALVGRKYYIAQELTQQQRILKFDYEHISKTLERIENSEGNVAHYQERRVGAKNSNDLLAQGILQQTAKGEKEYLKGYLENTLKGFEQFGITLDTAHDYMKDMSLGTFDLRAILRTYLSSD